jgi:hypothetical protein
LKNWNARSKLKRRNASDVSARGSSAVVDDGYPVGPMTIVRLHPKAPVQRPMTRLTGASG